LLLTIVLLLVLLLLTIVLLLLLLLRLLLLLLLLLLRLPPRLSSRVHVCRRRFIHLVLRAGTPNRPSSPKFAPLRRRPGHATWARDLASPRLLRRKGRHG
jgi:hypothetical protein